LFLSAGIDCADGEKTEADDDPIRPPPAEIPSQTIINHMLGVAAKPVHWFGLHGLTLGEAEHILYGDRAEGFFMEQYGDIKKEGTHLRVRAFRTSSVKKKIAAAYAHRYQRYYRLAIKERETRQTQIRQVQKPNQSKNPPPCAVSLVRWDGLLDEVYRFDDGNPCVLRIVGGFAVNDLYILNACM
jgi:hypothetical protein